jgi:hypothetical protein
MAPQGVTLRESDVCVCVVVFACVFVPYIWTPMPYFCGVMFRAIAREQASQRLGDSERV